MYTLNLFALDPIMLPISFILSIIAFQIAIVHKTKTTKKDGHHMQKQYKMHTHQLT